MTPEAAKAIVGRWIVGLWDRGEFDLVDELAARGYSFTGPGYPKMTREAYVDLVRSNRVAFPDLENTIEGQVADSGTVVTWGTSRATHRGPLGSMPATGRRIEMPWVIVTTFAGDRIVSDWELYDALSLMQQLGALPATA